MPSSSDGGPNPSRGSSPSSPSNPSHLDHKAGQVLLRQPLVNRRRQKEPGLDRPEVAHRGNILEKRSKRALSLSGSPHGVKSDRLLEIALPHVDIDLIYATPANITGRTIYTNMVPAR